MSRLSSSLLFFVLASLFNAYLSLMVRPSFKLSSDGKDHLALPVVDIDPLDSRPPDAYDDWSDFLVPAITTGRLLLWEELDVFWPLPFSLPAAKVKSKVC